VPPLGPGWPWGSGVLISVGTGVGEASWFRVPADGEATMSCGVTATNARAAKRPATARLRFEVRCIKSFLLGNLPLRAGASAPATVSVAT
jgi:hypothetical protein